MIALRHTLVLRRLAAVVACVMALQQVATAAYSAALAAERGDLRALGLANAIICHNDGTSAGKPQPGKPSAPGTLCDCCMTGCAGSSGPAALPADSGALVRPLLAADAATRIAAHDAVLRSYLSERTHAPRSPPALA